MQTNQVIFDKEVPKLLDNEKGKLFSARQISKEIDWANYFLDSFGEIAGEESSFMADRPIMTESNLDKWLKKELKTLVNNGIILQEKKGKALYYYVDETSRLEKAKEKEEAQYQRKKSQREIKKRRKKIQWKVD